MDEIHAEKLQTVSQHASGLAQETLVTLHRHEVPSFVEHELARLYGNIYSSLVQWRSNGIRDEDVNTYVVRRGSDIVALLLYRCDGTEVRVLNEGIVLEGALLERFTSDMFSAYPQLRMVTFHAVRSGDYRLTRPCQRFNCLEDIVLTLPPTVERYLAGMGSSTRSYIKRYLNKLKRDFPSFSHEIYVGPEIPEQDFKAVVDLNRIRMAGKGKTSGVDEQESRRIYSLAKTCGMLSVVRINGRVCAGTINYEVGGNYFLEVIAHDPIYNEYRLGTLGCYLTICECIARGGKEYHFLWGQHDYKFRLLGKQQDLDHLCVYRSRIALLRQGALVFGNVYKAWLRRAALWMRSAQKKNGLLAHVVPAIVQSAREFRATLITKAFR